MKCPTCGRHITPRSNFCPYCGKPAAPRRTKSQPQTISPRWPLYTALILAGIAIGVFSFYWLQSRETVTATAAATDFDPMLRGEQLAKLYPAVYEVAAQFNCPCGDCNDGVEVCDCDMVRGATEVRTFIYQLLQVHKPAHVIEMVEEKYGHRKAVTSNQ
ncbi:zinc ribbon domain-containing protein [candidate division KSB1 bacterium]|nr:zinc ribbon domain-containing protein [candidate division KSB1 bacterium]